MPTVTWATPAEMTYGTALSGTQLNATASVPGTFAYNPTSGTILQAGQNQTLRATFTPTDTATYETVPATVSIDVAKAPLTITADSKSKVYGAALPELSARYSGFVNGEDATILTAPVSLTTTATSSSNAGGYAITPGGAGSANYTITFVNDTLTVSPAPLTIQPNDLAMRQSAAVPTLTATYTGFVNGDTAASLIIAPTLTTTATSASPPGSYPITASGAASSNYTLLYESGALTVTEFNELPTLSEISDQTIDEDTVSEAIVFIVGDLETSATELIVTGASSNPGLIDAANIAFGGTGVNRTVTLTPLANQFGTAEITLTVRDAVGGQTNRLFNLTVRSVNDAPVLAAINNQVVNEESLLTVNGSASNIESATETLAFSLDPGAPSGAAINPANGLFTWTPSEAQGPGTASITIRVTDNGTPPLSAAQTFTVTVNEVNVGPLLAEIGNQTADEGSSLSFGLSGSDADIPSNTLTYSFGGGAPSGATLSSSGVFSWTPGETQGPGSYSITVQVSDNANPPLTAVRTFSVTVNEVNQSPALAPIASRTVDEGGPVSLQVQGSDPDVPAQSLTYSLGAGGPAGASINAATGVFSWNPSEEQGPGSYAITVNVSDNGTPLLSASQSFSVTVNEVNVAPFLAGIANQSVPEGGTMTAFVAGADLDRPAQRLTYSVGNAPTGVSIDPVSGVVSWTPTESQGGATYSIAVILTDDGPGNLSASQSFQVVVIEVNSAPVFSPIASRTIKAGSALSVSVSASDPDIPANTLAYSLPFGGPPGALLDPVSGLFSWTPDPQTAAGPVSVTVQVSDNGIPPLSATTSFSIEVSAGNSSPNLSAIANQTVDEGKLLTVRAAGTDPEGQSLSYTLESGAPAGMGIDPASGVLTWTPGEEQGPGSSSVTVRVTDNGTPPLSATQSFGVTVNEVNAAPVIPPIGDQTAEAGVLVSFNAGATDADLPANRLTYGLEAGAPDGAAIDPASGAFSWTPSLAQAGTTHGITVRVTDNGTPSLSASASFSIVVAPSNRAPVLTPIGDQTVDEQTQLTVTIAASDPDQPAQVLTYEISGAPPGAGIDPASGVFTWTPNEDQGPGTSTITVKVSDNGTPPLSVTGSFSVIAREVNKAPVLNAIADQRIEQGRLLSFPASATDPDFPANTLTYSLGNGAPAGAGIDPASGVFTWTPSAQQAPGPVQITVQVADNGVPILSASQSFTVVVSTVNTAPTLGVIVNQTVNEGQALSFTAVGTDTDLPPQRLAYSLGAGAPSGASIDPRSGVFTFTPIEAQGPVSNVFSVRVTDDGTPPLRASQDVRLVINEVNRAPVLSAIADQTLGVGDTLNLQAKASDADLPANPLSFSLGTGAPAGASIDPASGILTWTATVAQGGAASQVTVIVSDNGVPPLSDSKTFTATVRAGPNLPPTISAISDQTTPENTPTASIAFTVNDPDTPIGNLSLRATSSDTTLAPTASISFGGSGTDRTVRITPARNQTGTATITIEVNEPAGGKASVSFGVTVAPLPPEIVRQPADQTVLGGSVLTLGVVASGSAPLTYQWSFNGGAIGEATNSVFSVANAKPENAGTYSVEIANGVGRFASRTARVEVTVLLRIVEQPQDQKVLAGGSASFRVVASGTPPLRYQWSVNGTDVPRGTNAVLSLANVEPILAGRYGVAVSDASGTLASQSAVLEVLSPAAITGQPVNQTVPAGTDVTFSVNASGAAPLAYQWLYNGVNLSGATGSTLSLPGVGVSNAGSYAVLVSNGSGSVTSEGARLTVSQPPVITRQPQGRRVLAGAAVDLAVVVSATPPLSYQWKKDGQDIAGATGANLSLNNITIAAAGEYSVMATNAAGSVTSEGALVEVTQPVAITTQPADQTVVEGSAAGFSVSATGTAPLNYQWQKDGVNVTGAIAATLSVASARAADAGNYQVVVRNAAGPVASAPAKLTVNLGVKIVAQPQSLTVTNGSGAVFTVGASGTAPLSYQWRFNGAAIAGATGSVLSVPSAQPSSAGGYSVQVRNAVGSVTSAEAQLKVLIPPAIQTQPAGVTVDLGASASFTVAASGDAPLSYQWKRNGGNLAGATSQTLALNSVQAADAGSYSVVVQNPGGAVTSQAASLTLNLPALTTGNSAATAPPPIEQAEGTFNGGDTSGGGNQIARRNASPGTGSERWFAWRAPGNGIATFSTAGSSFDTVMWIYTGTSPNLTAVGADDDRGGFLSSEVRFNAVQGTAYLINVKGFEGATGQIVVGFKLEATVERLPELVNSPESRTAIAGSDVTFTVAALGTQLSYQWLADGVEIAGATGPSLVLSGVKETDAKNYSVRTASGARTVESAAASLQVGTIAEVAQDKFKNAVGTAGSAPQLQSLANRSAGLLQAGGSAATLAFSTVGSGKEAGEPNHCEEAGGTSRWIKYAATQSGVVRFSTEGSAFDTVLAVYRGVEFASLTLEGCDNNSGSDGKSSVVNVAVTAGRTYYVAVDGVGGAAGLVKLSYEAGQKPEITVQPQGQTVEQGSTAALFVLTSGGAGLSFQWYKDGGPIAGETSQAVQFLSVNQGDAGSYEVEISNFAGTVRSQTVELLVNVPVTVSVPPEDAQAGLGGLARFAVVVSGSEPIIYQWSLNGIAIPGATEPVYEIPSVQVLDAGSYVVSARNSAGTIESRAAVLTLNQAPVIGGGPQSVAAVLGGGASFNVVASGTGNLSYQWRFNGLDLAGATEASLAIANVRAQDVGDYTVVVSNGAGSVESAPGRLSVSVPLSVVEQPQNQTVTAGSSAAFTVRAAGAGPFGYQWKKEGVEIAGATGQTFIVASAQANDAGTYTVVVSRGAESIESEAAGLTVSSLPVITQQPQSQVVYAGSVVTLEVAATGSGPLGYQWTHEGIAIAGATNAVLTLPRVESESAGVYLVDVSNSAGGVESQLAVLTLREVVSDARLDAGGFGFRLNVPEGRQARVQFTTDFADWTDLFPAPLAGTVDVTDPDAFISELRFYRVLIE
ncbi:MAG: immunoglobulin domain-containing protein [Verrucomicrobia bacterium]|nr:immunoglobulin domain-containing protein [Verrucomicrobiota bacterium]